MGYGLTDIPKTTDRKVLEAFRFKLESYIDQINSALKKLHPRRHAAAIDCLERSREILRGPLAEVNKQLAGSLPDIGKKDNGN